MKRTKGKSKIEQGAYTYTDLQRVIKAVNRKFKNGPEKALATIERSRKRGAHVSRRKPR